jgi:hypothetical protein
LQVVGVPVTLNGDLKNQFVETNVGFDTICKVWSNDTILFYINQHFEEIASPSKMDHKNQKKKRKDGLGGIKVN